MRLRSRSFEIYQSTPESNRPKWYWFRGRWNVSLFFFFYFCFSSFCLCVCESFGVEASARFRHKLNFREARDSKQVLRLRALFSCKLGRTFSLRGPWERERASDVHYFYLKWMITRGSDFERLLVELGKKVLLLCRVLVKTGEVTYKGLCIRVFNLLVTHGKNDIFV